MKRHIILLCLLQIVILGQPGLARDIERTVDIEKTLRFGDVAGDRLVVVDNVFGSIEVVGYNGEEVRVKIRKTIVARSNKKVAEAEEEVTLEVTEDDDLIELYVDGPFREKRKRGVNWRGYKREGYKVIFDFELEVPKGCAVELRTVNEGDINVNSVEGDFDVNNVNGGIEMKGVRGSGAVYTVNGKVLLEFDDNPKDDCSFGTINGDVRLYFQRDLSADFYLKTMNGEVYTDFEVAALPVRTKKSNSRNGKKTYKVGHMSGVRAGKGGPEIELNTLNGDMFILSR
ncbi:MAG: hypothetical protein JSW58_16610 [Candidatus Latescibacterota bacterium]|nr:MAG: hypothetical protein JSW58_16610 [Candidatus Latescibacterota bacterium]